jgi:competence protein ComEC
MIIIEEDFQQSAGPFSEVMPRLVWTMAGVCEGTEQGDAHLISIDDQHHVLIDAGSREMAAKHLLPLLRQEGIKSFDLAFISHAHKDHYGGLDVLLEHDIKIRRLYFNLPDREQCRKEIPWGCDYDDVIGVRDRLHSRGIEIRRLQPGLRFEPGSDTLIEVLYVFDGVHTPIGRTDVNDMSAVIKVHHGEPSILFPGDLNEGIGGYLAETADDLKADIIKVPHHGVDPVAPIAFMERVAPRCALVSAPVQFWLESTSDRLRNWFAQQHIPVWVNGIAGHVRVIIQNNTIQIETARRPAVYSPQERNHLI